MDNVKYIGNLSVFCSAKGNVSIPVAGGVIFGYCLSDSDLDKLKSLATGPVEDVAKTGGKRLPLGTVSCELIQVDELDDGERVSPVYKFASTPVRAEDHAKAVLFG